MATLVPGRFERDFPYFISPCFIRSVAGSPGRLVGGYLVLIGESRYFISRGLLRPSVNPLGGATPAQQTLDAGLFFDVLSLRNTENHHDTVYLTKDWSRAVRNASSAEPARAAAR